MKRIAYILKKASRMLEKLAAAIPMWSDEVANEFDATGTYSTIVRNITGEDEVYKITIQKITSDDKE